MPRRKDRGAPALILPGYQDAVEIGGGAFASVYRATEMDTGRQVALKILKIDSVHPRLIETFSRETQALAQVSDHPNIVTLYRTLTTPDGRPVLVLELCRQSLGQQVRQVGPLRAHEVTRVGIKIAGALETAHRHEFLHRDMKPQNILVTQFGEPALGDFGVAALQASAQATAGVFGFTTLHAAPEMLEGHRLSPATDVYGLASTMYQLLTGLAPFAAFDNEAPASVILRIIRDPVRPLRAEDIPLALADLLEAALSKAPDERPGSAIEFADALVAVEAASGWGPTAYVAWGQVALAPPTVSPTNPAGAPPPAAAPPPPPLTARGVASPAPTAASPSGPAVTAPEPAPRQVVMPDRVDEGSERPDPLIVNGGPQLGGPPPSANPEDTVPRPARPVFIDPPAPADFPGRTPPLPRESVYEQTILPSLGESSSPRESAASRSGQTFTWSPLLIGAMVSAALVVVAALLLVFGVL